MVNSLEESAHSDGGIHLLWRLDLLDEDRGAVVFVLLVRLHGGGTTILLLHLFPLDFGKTITLTGTPCVQSLDFKHVSDQSVSPVE